MSLEGFLGLWQLWSWQLLVFTNRRESECFQSMMLPEEAENSDQSSPDHTQLNSKPPANTNVLIGHQI